MLYVFLVIYFLIGLGLIGLGFSSDLKSEVERLKERAKEMENLIPQVDPKLYEKAKEEAEKAVKSAPKLEDLIKQKQRESKEASLNGELYLFISSSVPKSVLKTYVKDISKTDGAIVMVMRGFVGGAKYLKPTAKFLHEILGEEPVEVWVDPTLFRKFVIKEVPALVYVYRGEPYIVYGDMSLEFMLQEIKKATNDPSLDVIIEKLGGRK